MIEPPGSTHTTDTASTCIFSQLSGLTRPPTPLLLVLLHSSPVIPRGPLPPPKPEGDTLVEVGVVLVMEVNASGEGFLGCAGVGVVEAELVGRGSQ